MRLKLIAIIGAITIFFSAPDVKANDVNFQLKVINVFPFKNCITHEIREIKIHDNVAKIAVKPIQHKEFGGHCGCISAQAIYTIEGYSENSESPEKPSYLLSQRVTFGEMGVLEFHYDGYYRLVLLASC